MDIKLLRENLKQVGSLAVHGKSEKELTEMLCLLAEDYDKTELRLVSATWPYIETGAKTEWRVWEKETQMRNVWIMKKVTRFADTDLEVVEESHVMVVDRQIADQIVALLNGQPNPLV